jgi:HK97 gp10 family phage protein
MARPGVSVQIKATVNVAPMVRWTKEVRRGSETAVRMTGIWLKGQIITSLEGGGRGHKYRRYPGGPFYRASAPGQAPARRMGALANSINFKYNGIVGRFMAGGPSGIVYSSSEYAPHLEYGTVHMAPRPFMRPAARKAEKVLEAAMRDVVRFP